MSDGRSNVLDSAGSSKAITKSAAAEARVSLLGRLLARAYPYLPFGFKRLTINAIKRVEGGDFLSGSLRRILAKYYGIDVGAHSYGSLLEPGMCDPRTTIGRYVSVGPNVRRFGAAHPVDSFTMHPYWYNPALGLVPASADVTRGQIVIESEVWIGANVTILPGCTRIGFGAVIGAGSVVTKDVADFSVVVGNPARAISTRLTADDRERLLATKPWDFPPTTAERMRVALIKESE